LTKNALKKTLGHAYVTLSSLQITIAEIEAHLNNHPLTYLSLKPEPLMSSNLLYGRIIDTLPHVPTTYLMRTTNTSKKAKVQALIIQHFWNRWKREYFTSLKETQSQ